ncbi:DUF2378 family protein [Archangium violaceum]|uniref:TIGR02265 family protein n=1 Tax=Archangium violaceum TaxID=83451 RepID=UPI0019516F26|nr:DUF2378 family protein [Archangium violaceum]QRO00463.1 DUF2378 family protein [Archangium violaceum]
MEQRAQLLSRLSRCNPGQQVPGMFLDAVLVSADARSAEVGGLARRLLGEGERLVESYRYPVAWMLGMLDVIGQAAVANGESYGEALFHCGQDAGRAYVRSSVGRVRALGAIASGLHRTLEGIPSAAAVAVNFGEHSYRRLSASSGELVFKQDMIGLAWNAGMVVASTSAALSMGPDELKFEGIPTDEDASSFLLRISW